FIGGHVITQNNREECEQLSVDVVKNRVAQSLYDEQKLREARQWLTENDPAWVAARAAQGANTRATIALVLSGIAILVAMASATATVLMKAGSPRWQGCWRGQPPELRPRAGQPDRRSGCAPANRTSTFRDNAIAIA